jgi:anti-sigma B factor antagonist
MEALGRAFAMPEESLSLKVRRVKDVTVIDLKGRLIMGEPVDKLNAEVQNLLKQGAKHLAINLAGVTYVDSTGIASMADATTGAKSAGGECKFFAATSRVLQLLRVTRLDTAFIMLADEDSALSSF